jgi:hypothetical protein
MKRKMYFRLFPPLLAESSFLLIPRRNLEKNEAELSIEIILVFYTAVPWTTPLGTQNAGIAVSDTSDFYNSQCMGSARSSSVYTNKEA